VHSICPLISPLSTFYHPDSLWWSVQVITIVVVLCKFLRPFVTFRLLCPNIQPLFSQTFSIYVLSSGWQTKFHAHTNQKISEYEIFEMEQQLRVAEHSRYYWVSCASTVLFGLFRSLNLTSGQSLLDWVPLNVHRLYQVWGKRRKSMPNQVGHRHNISFS
jgi:hypothetical protein